VRVVWHENWQCLFRLFHWPVQDVWMADMQHTAEGTGQSRRFDNGHNNKFLNTGSTTSCATTNALLPSPSTLKMEEVRSPKRQ